MKTLTLWEPWATLVVAGHKKIETRSWSTAYRGPLLIHSAKRWQPDQMRLMNQEPFKGCVKDLESQITKNLGHVIGICCLDRILATHHIRNTPLPHADFAEHELAFGDYGSDRYGWLLSNVAQFNTPLPATGLQKIWEFNAPAWVQRIAEPMKSAQKEEDSLFD